MFFKDRPAKIFFGEYNYAMLKLKYVYSHTGTEGVQKSGWNKQANGTMGHTHWPLGMKNQQKLKSSADKI